MLVLFRQLGDFLRLGWFGLRRFRLVPCIGRFRGFFFLRHSLLLYFWLSSAAFGCHPPDCPWSPSISSSDSLFLPSASRPLAAMATSGDQASTFVHPFLWTRSALRLELGLAPLYHSDYIIRVHRASFAFFFGSCFGGSRGHREACAATSFRDRLPAARSDRKGGSVFRRAPPLLIPTSTVPSRPMGGHHAKNPAGWYLHNRETY